jgi:hypothetical protein
VAVALWASQEGLCSVEFVCLFVCLFVSARVLSSVSMCDQTVVA